MIFESNTQGWRQKIQKGGDENISARQQPCPIPTIQPWLHNTPQKTVGYNFFKQIQGKEGGCSIIDPSLNLPMIQNVPIKSRDHREEESDWCTFCGRKLSNDWSITYSSIGGYYIFYGVFLGGGGGGDKPCSKMANGPIHGQCTRKQWFTKLENVHFPQSLI